MTLAPGNGFGSYRVICLVGAGGMGEVYRARDPRLNRDVALKVLSDSHRLHLPSQQRFEREAQALAALNHPNIATLHGIEASGDVQALVMEYVEGQTLAEMLANGPLTLTTASGIARQLAEALDTAHERGLVHRDLKPANIKVREDGTVKVLDFGLAKAFAPPTEGSDPQITTVTGVDPKVGGFAVGTPAYMSPEQMRGLRVDKRADIWAFGCVLFEMLAGRRAFDARPDAVPTYDPDWSVLPSDMPPALRRLLQRCLEKDPRRRLRDIADAREHLDDAAQESTPPAASVPAVSRISRIVLVASVLIPIVGLAVLAAIHFSEAPPQELRLELATPPTTVPLQFALSPDGRYMTFVASKSPADRVQVLYLRALDNPVARPLSGTEGAQYPFWSPDSRSIAFFAAEKLLRVDIEAGPPHALATASNPLGGAWSTDGTILFAPNSVSPLLRVPASGGTPTAATHLDSPRQKNHRFPVFLGDSRQFLFHAEGEPEASGVYLGSLQGGAPKRLIGLDDAGGYLPPDRVIYVQEDALVARRLDASRGQLTGDLITLAKPIGSPIGFSTSRTGVVAYRAGGVSRSAAWFDRKGTMLERADSLTSPEMSPDGRYVAGDLTVKGNRDVWILDLARGAAARFTSHPAVDGYPVWSPDGSRLAFHSQRSGDFDIWIKQVNGAADTEELLVGTPDNEWPLDWSPDGRFLLYHKGDRNYGSWDLWVMPMTGGDARPIAVANTAFEERLGQFSPDGRWIAYDTDESGRREIVVQAFPQSQGLIRLSTRGGVAPRWSRDGKELYFVAPDGQLMAVPVKTEGATFTAGNPVALFSVGELAGHVFKAQYAVTRDDRFLFNGVSESDSAPPITLILNREP